MRVLSGYQDGTLSNMKTVQESDFRRLLSDALKQANFHLREDIVEYMRQLAEKEKTEKNRKIVELFLENNKIAREEERAVCQDTGYVQLFVRVGNNVHIGFDLEKAAGETVTESYEKLKLRKSIAHPVTRLNTGSNTPVFVDVELTTGDELEVTVMIKGGGSENVSRAEFLLPTSSEEDIADWAAEAVQKAGAKACPPYLIGIGIGGTLEKAVYHSKKLLLERIDRDAMDEIERKLADSIRKKINGLDIGFQGLKFGETAMAVKVKTIPCHIATLPVALSIGCNAVRQGYFKI
jgi:fumarate hydratase subunit alpha